MAVTFSYFFFPVHNLKLWKLIAAEKEKNGVYTNYEVIKTRKKIIIMHLLAHEAMCEHHAGRYVILDGSEVVKPVWEDESKLAMYCIMVMRQNRLNK